MRGKVLFFLILFLGSCATTLPPFQVPVTDGQASEALEKAVSVLGAPYLWAGNGPDTFDCSGLIVWAYREILEETDIFYNGSSVVSDVTMQMFYDHNTIPVDDPLPGDLVFITDEEGIITHGGLVEAVAPDEVTFIHASSFSGAVVREEPPWLLDGMVRDQWIVGFGRLVYCE